MTGYYADGSWATPGGAQQPTSGGGMAGTTPVTRDQFQVDPLFGGGSSYYDTAGGGAAGYEKFVQGLTGQSAGNTADGGKFGNWLRSRFNTVNNQYGAAQGQDPSLSFTNFLTNDQDSLQQQYLGQNPYDKGEQGQKALKWL